MKYARELKRCLRMGYSLSMAEASAKFAEMESLCRHPKRLSIPRVRCKFQNR